MSFERPNIARMTGYTSGEQPDDDKTIKLNTNENPYPPAPEVSQVLANIDTSALRRYPPPTANRFRDLAANVHGVRRDNIIATRGGDELLRLLLTTFTDPGELIFSTSPTYSLYPVLAAIQDCRFVCEDLDEDWQLPADFCDQANSLGAKLTLVVNPHAPSGQLISRDTIAAMAAKLEGLLLIDEAYIDFVAPDHRHHCLDLIEDHDNLIFLRTLSKGYSLAGLRFGYGIGAESLIQPMLTKTRDSYNLDLISQRLAEAAIQAQDYAQSTWEKVRSERQRVHGLLWEMGFTAPPSETNFLLARVPQSSALSAAELYEALKARGILIRYFGEPRLSNSLRITIGTPAENDALIDALRLLTGAN
ncbi:MAG: histidinol-phosphate transaminase [Pseudomonadales bacterium]|nr:histidinol-phosphate transaminase [Pseudomonadales bacterium]